MTGFNFIEEAVILMSLDASSCPVSELVSKPTRAFPVIKISLNGGEVEGVAFYNSVASNWGGAKLADWIDSHKRNFRPNMLD